MMNWRKSFTTGLMWNESGRVFYIQEGVESQVLNYSSVVVYMKGTFNVASDGYIYSNEQAIQVHTKSEIAMNIQSDFNTILWTV